MGYIRVFRNNLAYWAVGTFVAAFAVSLTWSMLAGLQADSVTRFFELFFFGFVIAVVSLCFGLPFSLLLVAPLHSLAIAHGRTSLTWALGIALLPAAYQWSRAEQDQFITYAFVVYGLVASLVAQWLRVTDFLGLGSNNSSKPTPLRGAA